jgi:phosphoribosyl 1,2-cyclic phosphate phosphodiesterase
MKVVVLGCGTSSGVPVIGCRCAVCRSPDPRNRRRRCALYIEAYGKRILIDTPPDLREQCLDAEIDGVDAILFTHAHADHTNGIDDVRQLNLLLGRVIDVYGDAAHLARIQERFEYAFLPPDPVKGFLRPALNPCPIQGRFRVGDVEIVPFPQRHGRGAWTTGFRFGRFAYSTDCDELTDEAFETLAGVDVWLVDALRDRPHPSHAHLERTLRWIERVRPKRALLTHMSHEVDYADWESRLPPGVAPAVDGMRLDLT